MGTQVDERLAQVGDPTPPVQGSDRWSNSHRFGPEPELTEAPSDELCQYLLGVFLIHDSMRRKFGVSDETADAFLQRLNQMKLPDREKLALQVQQFLGVPNL